MADILNTWPQLISSGFVAVCSATVTLVVQRTAKKLENVATKEFVIDAMTSHETRMRQMFVDSSLQNVTNADIEFRMRRIEASVGAEIMRPPIIPHPK